MKTIIRPLFALAALICASCTDLTEINERLDDLTTRIEAVEAIIPSLNANIEALQKLAGGSTVNKVEEPSTGVYKLTLSNGSVITLNQGSIGVGKAPVMSIDSDGYWMADYQDGAGPQYVMCGDSKVAALGKDGVTPKFGVDADGYWTVSYDGGETFAQVKGADSNPVKAIGAEGATDSYFSDVTVEGDTLKLTLKSGKTYIVPILSDFLFAIKGADEIQLFNPGDTKSYEVEMKGVEDAIFSKPSGWEVSLSDLMLKIKAPASGTKATIADSEGEVAVLAISASGYSTIAKVKIQLAGSSVVVNPAASVSMVAKTDSSISFKVLTEDVTSWNYIFQKTAATAPDAVKLLSDGTAGSGSSLEFKGLESKTSYSLYVLPVNDTTLGTIASLAVTTDAEQVVLYADNLIAWNEGRAINIAGEKYSKKTYGDATVLKATTADFEMPALTAGVYILEAETNCNFKVSHSDAGMTISDEVILIGRYAASRPLVKMEGWAKISGGFAARDLKLDCSVSSKSYKFTFGTITDRFHIDACTIVSYNENQTYYGLNVTRSFRLVGSDIIYNKSNGAGAIGINFSKSTKLNYLKEITIEDNIFYNPAPAMYQLLGCNNDATLASQEAVAGGVSVSLCGNTFYNFTSSSAIGSMIYTASADLLTIDRNIFYTAMKAGAHRCVRFLSTSMPATCSFGTNIAYGLAYASAWKYVYDSAENIMTRVTESPFETVNTTSMTFTPIEAYAGYGAQRNK